MRAELGHRQGGDHDKLRPPRAADSFTNTTKFTHFFIALKKKKAATASDVSWDA